MSLVSGIQLRMFPVKEKSGFLQIGECREQGGFSGKTAVLYAQLIKIVNKT